MKVLLVDDDPDLVEALAELLEADGHQTLRASHGQEALARLRAASPLPDVIVLDLMMPVMDGWAFRAEQGADAALRRIPVVIFSAAGKVPRRDQLGEVVVLHKPGTPDLFKQTLVTACEGRRGAGAS